MLYLPFNNGGMFYVFSSQVLRYFLYQNVYFAKIYILVYFAKIAALQNCCRILYLAQAITLTDAMSL